MKIAWFHKNISPEIGAKLTGYGLNDVSTNKLGPRKMCGDPTGSCTAEAMPIL